MRTLHLVLLSVFILLAIPASSAEEYNTKVELSNKAPMVLDSLRTLSDVIRLGLLYNQTKHPSETVASTSESTTPSTESLSDQQLQHNALLKWQKSFVMSSGLLSAARELIDPNNTRVSLGTAERPIAALAHVSQAADIAQQPAHYKNLGSRFLVALISLAVAIAKNIYTPHQANTTKRFLFSLLQKIIFLIQYHLEQGDNPRTSLGKLAYGAHIANILLGLQSQPAWTKQEAAEQQTLKALHATKRALTQLTIQRAGSPDNSNHEKVFLSLDKATEHAQATSKFAQIAQTPQASQYAQEANERVSAATEAVDDLMRTTITQSLKTAKQWLKHAKTILQLRRLYPADYSDLEREDFAEYLAKATIAAEHALKNATRYPHGPFMSRYTDQANGLLSMIETVRADEERSSSIVHVIPPLHKRIDSPSDWTAIELEGTLAAALRFTQEDLEQKSRDALIEQLKIKILPLLALADGIENKKIKRTFLTKMQKCLSNAASIVDDARALPHALSIIARELQPYATAPISYHAYLTNKQETLVVVKKAFDLLYEQNKTATGRQQQYIAGLHNLYRLISSDKQPATKMLSAQIQKLELLCPA